MNVAPAPAAPHLHLAASGTDFATKTPLFKSPPVAWRNVAPPGSAFECDAVHADCDARSVRRETTLPTFGGPT